MMRIATITRRTVMPPATAMMRAFMTAPRSWCDDDLSGSGRRHVQPLARDLLEAARRRERRDLEIELVLLLQQALLDLAAGRELIADGNDLQPDPHQQRRERDERDRRDRERAIR